MQLAAMTDRHERKQIAERTAMPGPQLAQADKAQARRRSILDLPTTDPLARKPRLKPLPISGTKIKITAGLYRGTLGVGSLTRLRIRSLAASTSPPSVTCDLIMSRYSAWRSALVIRNGAVPIKYS